MVLMVVLRSTQYFVYYDMGAADHQAFSFGVLYQNVGNLEIYTVTYGWNVCIDIYPLWLELMRKLLHTFLT